MWECGVIDDSAQKSSTRGWRSNKTNIQRHKAEEYLGKSSKDQPLQVTPLVNLVNLQGWLFLVMFSWDQAVGNRNSHLYQAV